jgi:ADP-heptose:LPS heptosyltransferase
MALISNLDLVVQVSNASLHMAGALGVNTFALISTPHDFRWFPGKSSADTPWYNNMTLFRKKSSEEWRNLIHKAAQRVVF